MKHFVEINQSLFVVHHISLYFYSDRKQITHDDQVPIETELENTFTHVLYVILFFSIK